MRRPTEDELFEAGYHFGHVDTVRTVFGLAMSDMTSFERWVYDAGRRLNAFLQAGA